MADMSAADIAAITRNNDCCNDGFGMGGNGFASWILIFALLSGGGFGGWGGRDGRCSTVEDLASGLNFSGVNNKLNEIVAGQANINQNLGNAICQLGYRGAQHTYELGSKIDQCCCNTQLGIQGVKFDMANYAAATNANVTAAMQKILDKMCEDKQAAMAARIQSLELQQALCGIPRTNPYGYGIYAYPSCNSCGCGTVQTM